LKFSPKRLAPLAALAFLGFAAWADLPRWLQDVPALKRFEGVFFSRVDTPSGPVLARRNPKETRGSLDQLIAAAPTDAELYALRAQAAEEQVDIVTAEADWKRFAELAPDRAAGQLALADFYHRQLKPREELRAL
jgi:hypothetical protein